MSDAELRAAEKAWREDRESEATLAKYASALERAGRDLPVEVLLRHPRWRRIASFVVKWHERPLAEGDGYSAEELDDAEDRLDAKLPRALREWYRLGGKRRDVFHSPRLLR